MKSKFYLLLLLLISFEAAAQQINTFKITGNTQKHDTKSNAIGTLPRAKIVVYKDNQNPVTYKSDEKGWMEISNLEYGHIYKLEFISPGCVGMFMEVDANVPDKCRGEGFYTNIIFYEKKLKVLDTTKFVYPFMKAGCINGKEFNVDKKYRDDFGKGIIPPEMIAAHKKELEEKAKKEQAKLELEEKLKKEAELTKQNEQKKIKIAGKLIAGENPSKPISNITLKLLNETGEVVQTTNTNFLGAFVFYILPDKNYSFTGEDNKLIAANTKIIFTTKNDNKLLATTADAQSKFVFDLSEKNRAIIPLATVNDSELKMDLKGKLLTNVGASNKPLAEVKIHVLGTKQTILQTTTTSKEGDFSFTYLSAMENYTIAFDQDNPNLTGVNNVILTDSKGAIVKEAKDVKNIKDFKFEILPEEINKMGTMYVDDPWVNLMNKDSKETVITERIYFNVNDDKLLSEAKVVLDKVIAVLKSNKTISLEISSHTDSQGADDYNLKLSEKRAKAAVDYMIANGIETQRLTPKGYGEMHLLNKCANNVKCTEEEHAQNRRLEFKVIKK